MLLCPLVRLATPYFLSLCFLASSVKQRLAHLLCPRSPVSSSTSNRFHCHRGNLLAMYSTLELCTSWQRARPVCILKTFRDESMNNGQWRTSKAGNQLSIIVYNYKNVKLETVETRIRPEKLYDETFRVRHSITMFVMEFSCYRLYILSFVKLLKSKSNKRKFLC